MSVSCFCLINDTKAWGTSINHVDSWMGNYIVKVTTKEGEGWSKISKNLTTLFMDDLMVCFVFQCWWLQWTIYEKFGVGKCLRACLLASTNQVSVNMSSGCGVFPFWWPNMHSQIGFMASWRIFGKIFLCFLTTKKCIFWDLKQYLKIEHTTLFICAWTIFGLFLAGF